MIRTSVLLLFILSLAACEGRPGESPEDMYLVNEKAAFAIVEESAYDVPVTQEAEPPVPSADVPQLVEKKIIKDGRMQIEVDDLNKSKTQVDAWLEQFDAYYANESFEDSDYRSEFHLTIRIPAGRFEAFAGSFDKDFGDVLVKEITARDVTEEFIDLETRLENKRSYLERYRELLKRANSIKEILEIEDKIRMVEEEIESAEGRLRYLKDKIALSTLNLSLFKNKDYVFEAPRRDKFTERLKESLVLGWRGIGGFILTLARIWPLVIFLILAFFGWRRWRRTR